MQCFRIFMQHSCINGTYLYKGIGIVESGRKVIDRLLLFPDASMHVRSDLRRSFTRICEGMILSIYLRMSDATRFFFRILY